MANARSQWGGYFDLHREQLTDAIEEARACIEAAVGISAQYVFVAHATEYRQFLRDPSKLKPVLAILRDAIIKNYGEQVRTTIQGKEAQQLERASEDWNTDSELEIEYAAPLLAGDASFWRARRNDFREYNTGANSLLSADWDSMTESWLLRGSAAARSVFESLATIAAKGLQTYDPDEPWRSWLDELRRRKRNYRESPTKVAYSRRALEDPSKFGIEPPKVKGELRTGTVDRIAMTELFGRETGERQESSFAQTRFTGVDRIAERLFEASINLCLEFEAATVINVGHREDRDTSTKEGPDREAPKRKPAKQNQRYKTIDGALRQIAEARPATQGEVFKMLGERHVGIPNAEPFLTARGWMAGFEGDEAAARA